MLDPTYDPMWISIHVLREEDDEGLFGWLWELLISIHVLREEDDVLRTISPPNKLDISIHVLREEDDPNFYA